MSSAQALFILLSLTLAFIVYFDLRYMVIPNALNGGLAIIGCVFRLTSGAGAFASALLFGCVVFLSFMLFGRIYELARGHIGLGGGDVKFLGAAAIWLDPSDFPLFVLVASFCALCCISLFLKYDGNDGLFRIPFGPFLSFSLLVVVGHRFYEYPFVVENLLG